MKALNVGSGYREHAPCPLKVSHHLQRASRSYDRYKRQFPFRVREINRYGGKVPHIYAIRVVMPRSEPKKDRGWKKITWNIDQGCGRKRRTCGCLALRPPVSAAWDAAPSGCRNGDVSASDRLSHRKHFGRTVEHEFDFGSHGI